jgi:predicted site-specific integrase-resolvase
MSTDHIQSLLMSRQETRERLDASDFSLQRWHNRGYLRGLISNGRVVAYVRKDVERFARNNGAHRAKPGRKPFAKEVAP